MPYEILVVDDEPDLEFVVRQKFRGPIRRQEMTFVFARSGLEALEKLRASPAVDLVVTDINMPGMDGLALLARLRELDPPPRAIVVSAYGDLRNIRAAMNRGACDFLTKPVDLSDLDATVRKTLAEVHASQEAMAAREELVGLRRDLELAQRIQRALLPRPHPTETSRGPVEVCGEMLPARVLGGDFYDHFDAGDARLGFLIADVSGKGVPAALYMAMSSALLRSAAHQAASPAECFQKVNDILSTQGFDSMFVSAFYGVLHLPSGELEYVNAGHLPPFLLHSTGRVEALELPPGPVLGLFEGCSFESRRTLLLAGDLVCLYTDGVTEAEQASNEQYSAARVAAFLERNATASLNEIVRGLCSEVLDFSSGVDQTDDITVLCVRRTA